MNGVISIVFFTCVLIERLAHTNPIALALRAVGA
jgi:hypothetical protein